MSYKPDSLLSYNQTRPKDSHLTFGVSDGVVSATAQLGLVVKLAGLRITASIGYDNQVSRDPAPLITSAIQAGTRQCSDQALGLHAAPDVASLRAQGLTPAMALAVQDAQQVRQQARASQAPGQPYTTALPLGKSCRVVQDAMLRAACMPRMAWQLARPAQNATAQRSQAMLRYRPESSQRWQAAAMRQHRHGQILHPGNPVIRYSPWRWQCAILTSAGRSRWSTTPTQPDETFYTRSGHLTFKWPATETSSHLTFMADSALAPREPARTILIRSVYIVLNTVTLTRVDTGKPVVCMELDINMDADSWTPSWSATLAFHEYEALRAERGQPIEFLASLNGHTFSLLMEGAPQRDRSFGQTTVKIKGRGLSAWLDAPYADTTTFSNPTAPRTAQQIMADALSINGVSLGWDLDWQITDWAVPAGAWSYQGSNMAALIEIANSVGAIVQTSRTGQQIQILPRYPIAPWEWNDANPDIRIPLSITTTDSIEPATKPAYNAVYVSGQSYGITGYVKRQGTAGDLLASTVTHSLITHADAARQRGIAILGAGGRQESISMTLPLNEDTGLLRLNMLAEVPDTDDTWRGLVRSVGLSARWEDSAGTTIWQKIGMERHYVDN